MPNHPFPEHLSEGPATDRKPQPAPSRPKRLEHFESLIEKFKTAKRRAGGAFKVIRDQKLYEPEFDGFSDYCKRKWDYTTRYVDYLIRYAETYSVLQRENFRRLPENESQARPLYPLKPWEQVKAWREVLKKVKGDRITARRIRGIVSRWREKGDVPRPDDYEKVFDGTEGLRVRLPESSVPGSLRDRGFEDLGDYVLPQEALETLPSTADLIREYEEAGRTSFFHRESTFGDIAAQEWSVVARGDYGPSRYHFQEDPDVVLDGDDAFMPVYQPEELLAPTTTPKPGRNEGREARFVQVAPEFDLFDPRMPERVVDDVLHVMKEAAGWQYFIATDHLDRLDGDFPENAWIGATARTKEKAAQAVSVLSGIEGGRRWLLADPDPEILTQEVLDCFDWIVIGGLTDEPEPLTLSWAEASRLIAEAEQAGCTLFLRGGIAADYKKHPATDAE